MDNSKITVDVHQEPINQVDEENNQIQATKKLIKMANSKSDEAVSKVPKTLRLPLLGLNIFGLSSANAFKKYFLMTIYTLITTNLIIITLIQFTNIKNDISDFVRNLEGLSPLLQLLGKITVISYRKNDFIELIKETYLFWDYQKCNEQTKAELNTIRNLIYNFQKFFCLALLMCIVFLMLVPLLEDSIAFGIWTLEGYRKLYKFVIIEQFLVMAISVIFVSALDNMYLGFCVEIVVQFKILSYYIKELTAEGNNFNEMKLDYLNKIQTCVQHHIRILRFVKKFRQTFSLILLIEYFTASPLACAELLAASESHFYQNQIRHAILFAFLSMQLSFYCIPANYIADEAQDVSVAVYSSNWYSHYFPTAKIPLLLMIQNSQKGITMKAGGLITVNAETVVNVIKAVWSTCSILRGMRQN